MKAVFGEETELDEAYRLPSDSEIDKVKAHVKANHPNKSLAQVAVHKQTKKIEYVVKDKEGKMTGHTLGESVEQIDELSKNTLKSYGTKAAMSNFKKSLDMKTAQQKWDKSIIKKHLTKRPEFTDAEKKKMDRRAVSSAKALYKGYSSKNEEVEQIDELSKDTLNSYVHKAFAQGNDLHYDLAHSRGNKATDAERAALKAKLSKRNTGIIKAAKKLREDDKVYDEKWKKYVGKSFKKATE
jgi:hypothetical protein